MDDLSQEHYERMRKAMAEIVAALKPLETDAERHRLLKAVCVLYDVRVS